MANKEGTGKIDEMSEKENRLSFKIAGRYYTLWAQGEEQSEKDAHLLEIKKSVKPGMFVAFSYREKENPSGGAPYKNLVSIKQSTPEAASAAQGATASAGSASIAPGTTNRQTALECAVEFSKTQLFNDVVDDLAKSKTLDKMGGPVFVVTGIADVFDEWLQNKPKPTTIKFSEENVE